MDFETFGDVRIVRPALEVEDLIRRRARAHLFSRFAPGEYRGGAAVNELLRHQYQFYDGSLRNLIPRLASRGAVEFLLAQNDEAWRLLHGRGILDLKERERWKWIEPRFRRAIKFIVELMCMQGTFNKPPVRSPGEARTLMGAAISCAENIVALAQQSDTAYSVFPDHCVASVFDAGPYDFAVEIEGEFAGYDEVFTDRVVRDRNSRQRFVAFPQFDNHTATHQQYLDDAFLNSFGMSYGEFIFSVKGVIDHAEPSLHPQASPALFVRREDVINEIGRTGWPRQGIEAALDGFSVTRENLIEEKRAAWNPKQESRAYRRGFFIFPDETGPHLAFSRAMAQESLLQLVNWISYQHLPTEWRTSVTASAVAELSRGSGKWFEGNVSGNLRALGMKGERAHRLIGKGDRRIQVPSSVGEIDFLGYHPEWNCLLVAEAKMVMTGLEARYWRDDIKQFVSGSSSYAERFRRKIAWVTENAAGICEAMEIARIPKIAPVMLTLYPCIARMFIRDFECVSITEFMLDCERASAWPY